MARGTWVMRDGKLVPKHLAPPLTPKGERSALPIPYVISDNLGGIHGLVHPSTGQRYDSKARFRAETEARGLTEVGNESFPVNKGPSEREQREEVGRAIADTYDALEAGAIKPLDAKPLDSTLINADIARPADAII